MNIESLIKSNIQPFVHYIIIIITIMLVHKEKITDVLDGTKCVLKR